MAIELCIAPNKPGEIVRNFEKLHFLQMQDNDREQLQRARKILERIIHKNGYRVAYRTQQAICKK